jgi:hypothetical protein
MLLSASTNKALALHRHHVVAAPVIIPRESFKALMADSIRRTIQQRHQRLTKMFHQLTVEKHQVMYNEETSIRLLPGDKILMEGRVGEFGQFIVQIIDFKRGASL